MHNRLTALRLPSQTRTCKLPQTFCVYRAKLICPRRQKKGLSLRKETKYLAFVGFIVSGTIITAIGLYAALVGFAGSTWEIMGRVMQSDEWGWYLSALGIILLFIGAILAYFYFRKK